MSKDEQTVKAITDALARLRGELVAYVKAHEDKIAALELTYETLTGKPAPKDAATPARKTRTPAQPVVVPAPTGRRRGMRIDRQGASKAYTFLQERGEKPTTVAMVSRKFNITAEAAGQRLIKLVKEGKAARVGFGRYLDAALVQEQKNGAGSAHAKNENEAG